MWKDSCAYPLLCPLSKHVHISRRWKRFLMSWSRYIKITSISRNYQWECPMTTGLPSRKGLQWYALVLQYSGIENIEDTINWPNWMIVAVHDMCGVFDEKIHRYSRFTGKLPIFPCILWHPLILFLLKSFQTKLGFLWLEDKFIGQFVVTVKPLLWD